MSRYHDSTPDDIALCTMIENKFLELCQLYQRTKGVSLVIPEDIVPDAKRWRVIRNRHTGGDFRHTKPEMRGARAFAQWTLDVKKELCNQEAKTLEWKDEPTFG